MLRCHPHLCPVLGHFVGHKKRRGKTEAQGGGGGMYLTFQNSLVLQVEDLSTSVGSQR